MIAISRGILPNKPSKKPKYPGNVVSYRSGKSKNLLLLNYIYRMSYEKFYVEVTLVILLLVLLNGNLTLLQNLSSDIYGKIILIIAISSL